MSLETRAQPPKAEPECAWGNLAVTTAAHQTCTSPFLHKRAQRGPLLEILLDRDLDLDVPGGGLMGGLVLSGGGGAASKSSKKKKKSCLVVVLLLQLLSFLYRQILAKSSDAVKKTRQRAKIEDLLLSNKICREQHVTDINFKPYSYERVKQHLLHSRNPSMRRYSPDDDNGCWHCYSQAIPSSLKYVLHTPYLRPQ